VPDPRIMAARRHVLAVQHNRPAQRPPDRTPDQKEETEAAITFEVGGWVFVVALLILAVVMGAIPRTPIRTT